MFGEIRQGDKMQTAKISADKILGLNVIIGAENENQTYDKT